VFSSASYTKVFLIQNSPSKTGDFNMARKAAIEKTYHEKICKNCIQ
jgi:hypothetical protein